jgi:hypothetical protein
MGLSVSRKGCMMSQKEEASLQRNQ